MVGKLCVGLIIDFTDHKTEQLITNEEQVRVNRLYLDTFSPRIQVSIPFDLSIYPIPRVTQSFTLP